jgi:periplasmic protein TonB
MFGESTFQRGPRRRGLIGFLILGVHAGLVVLFALSAHAPRSQAELPPVTVEFLEDQPARLDPPPEPLNPRLAAITPPPVAPAPDVSMSVETEVHSEVVSESPAPPAPIALDAASGAATAAPAALTDVAYLEPPLPRYPPESKHAREEGLVILKVLIDESGHASSINVYRSSGHRRLDDAACKAVQRAVFKPYLDGGVARAAIALIPVEFSLHGAGDRGRRNG